MHIKSEEKTRQNWSSDDMIHYYDLKKVTSSKYLSCLGSENQGILIYLVTALFSKTPSTAKLIINIKSVNQKTNEKRKIQFEGHNFFLNKIIL